MERDAIIRYLNQHSYLDSRNAEDREVVQGAIILLRDKWEERKVGHWVVDNNYETYNGFGEVYKCDQCGYEIGWRDYSEIIKEIQASPNEMDEKQKRYFCPHCGTDMRGE